MESPSSPDANVPQGLRRARPQSLVSPRGSDADSLVWSRTLGSPGEVARKRFSLNTRGQRLETEPVSMNNLSQYRYSVGSTSSASLFRLQGRGAPDSPCSVRGEDVSSPETQRKVFALSQRVAKFSDDVDEMWNSVDKGRRHEEGGLHRSSKSSSPSFDNERQAHAVDERNGLKPHISRRHSAVLERNAAVAARDGLQFELKYMMMERDKAVRTLQREQERLHAFENEIRSLNTKCVTLQRSKDKAEELLLATQNEIGEVDDLRRKAEESARESDSRRQLAEEAAQDCKRELLTHRHTTERAEKELREVKRDAGNRIGALEQLRSAAVEQKDLAEGRLQALTAQTAHLQEEYRKSAEDANYGRFAAEEERNSLRAKLDVALQEADALENGRQNFEAFYKKAVSEAEQERDEAIAASSALQHQLAEATSVGQRLERRRGRMGRRFKSLEQQLEKAGDVEEDLMAEMEVLKVELMECERERDDNAGHLDKAREELVDLEETYERARDDLRSTNDLLDQAQAAVRELPRLKQERDSLKLQLSKLESDENGSVYELPQLKRERDSLKQQLNKLESDHNGSRDELEKYKRLACALRAEIQELQEEGDFMEQELQSYRDSNGSVKDGNPLRAVNAS